jgi:hypothetical protein
MFFENVWESQLSKVINKNTSSKIVISANSTHADLVKEVDEYELPSIYGGICDCKATCIYSEKGPWSEVENMINYKDPQPDSDEDEELNEKFSGFQIGGPPKKAGKQVIQFGGNEEFKMVEDDDDHIDLLQEKKKSKNINEFYAADEMDSLKSMLR